MTKIDDSVGPDETYEKNNEDILNYNFTERIGSYKERKTFYIVNRSRKQYNFFPYCNIGKLNY